MGKFAEMAKQALDAWEEKLQKQEARLHNYVPSTEEETRRKAVELLNKLRAGSYGFGHALRSLQQAKGPEPLLDDPTPGVPGREVVVDLPATKEGWYDPRLRSKEAGLLSVVTDPLNETVEDTLTELKNKADTQKDKLTRVTSDPSTLPWFLPAAAMTVPSSTMQGYRAADTEQRARIQAVLQQRVDAAKKDFEQALHEEYAARRKVASAGELIDGLAQFHVKRAEGEANQALGLYLALASLLASGSHMVAEEWVKKRDPRQQYASAVKELIKNRMRTSPPPIQVATEPMAAPKPEALAEVA